MLYQAYQTQSDLMSPLRLLAQGGSAGLWLSGTEGSVMRKLSASMDVFSRMRLTHTRPAYGIGSVMVGERQLDVTEEAVLHTPFGTLLRFKKDAPAATCPTSHPCCWWRRCQATSPRCCEKRCAPCCRTTTSTSPTGTTRAMCRCATAPSAWTTTSST